MSSIEKIRVGSWNGWKTHVVWWDSIHIVPLDLSFSPSLYIHLLLYTHISIYIYNSLPFKHVVDLHVSVAGDSPPPPPSLNRRRSSNGFFFLISISIVSFLCIYMQLMIIYYSIVWLVAAICLLAQNLALIVILIRCGI